MMCILHVVTLIINDMHTTTIKNIKYFATHKKPVVDNCIFYDVQKINRLKYYTFHDKQFMS